jgi:hypothetical protein
MRVKDKDIPGEKITILLGAGNNNTLSVPDIDNNSWYLIADSEINKLVIKFT